MNIMRKHKKIVNIIKEEMVNFLERELKNKRVSKRHGCYLVRQEMEFIFNNFDSIKAGKTSKTKTKKVCPIDS